MSHPNHLSSKKLENIDFSKDLRWMEEESLAVVATDLQISSFASRTIPLEFRILQCCKLLKEVEPFLFVIIQTIYTYRGLQHVPNLKWTK